MNTKTVAPASSPTSAYQKMMAEAKARRQLALKLDQEGKTNAEIGAVLGVSGERARQLVIKAIRENEAGK